MPDTTDTVTINVTTPFTLTHDDHTKQAFSAGLHQVSPAIAGHWYVQAHATAAAAGVETASAATESASTETKKKK